MRSPRPTIEGSGQWSVFPMRTRTICPRSNERLALLAADAEVGLEMGFDVGPFEEDASAALDVGNDAAALPVLDGADGPAEADRQNLFGDEAFGFGVWVRQSRLPINCYWLGTILCTRCSDSSVVVFHVHNFWFWFSFFSFLFAAACPFRR